MNISKFFCMLIAGLAIGGFTTIGLAEQEEGKQSEEIKSEAVAEVVLNVKGMTCAGCESKVNTALMNCEGVEGCEVNWKEGKATVKVAKGSANTALPKLCFAWRNQRKYCNVTKQHFITI